MVEAMDRSAEDLPYLLGILDNPFDDRLICIASYESLSPQHANAHANANLRLRAAVSGEANDPIVHLRSEDSVTRSVQLAGFSFCASQTQRRS
jgi:hypothetical protein